MPAASDREQRDAEMVRRYVDGETLDAIGQDYGVSRERVRQIVTKVGGALAAASRQRRIENRVAEGRAAADQFLATYGAIALAAADAGTTRDETVARLVLLYPDLDSAFVEAALRDSDIRFNTAAQELFSPAVIEAGVYYLVGSDLGLAPDPAYAAVHLDLALMAELADILQGGAASPADVATILGIIGAAKQHVVEHPETTITGARYDQLRDELVPALGWQSQRGSSPWPPTRQTLMKRHIYWNAALESMGLASTKRGRTPGLVKFTETLYRKAMLAFVEDMHRAGMRPSHDRYTDWCAAMNAAGHEYPSSAAVRNFFGTWAAAQRFAVAHLPPVESKGTVPKLDDETGAEPVAGASAEPDNNARKEQAEVGAETEPNPDAESDDEETAECPVCGHEGWRIARGMMFPPLPGEPEPKIWRAGCVISITPGRPLPKWHCTARECGWEW